MTTWIPADKEAEAKTAWAAPPARYEASTGGWAKPSTVNVTVPVGVSSDPGGVVTVAVKVTGWPAAGGFGTAARAVVEAIGGCPTPLENADVLPSGRSPWPCTGSGSPAC